MQWLRLHRNSKAKSHGSCCWHAEEAFPLASSLLSTSFAEAAQARLWGCPWLLASTCLLSPGQEVTDRKRLAKADPSRTNIFFILSFHSQESSGLAAQCICLLSSRQRAPPSACPVLLLCQLYQLVHFALLITFSVVMSQAMDVGGEISPKAIFPICKTCSHSKAHFFAISFIASLRQICHHGV